MISIFPIYCLFCCKTNHPSGFTVILARYNWVSFLDFLSRARRGGCLHRRKGDPVLFFLKWIPHVKTIVKIIITFSFYFLNSKLRQSVMRRSFPCKILHMNFFMHFRIHNAQMENKMGNQVRSSQSKLSENSFPLQGRSL